MIITDTPIFTGMVRRLDWHPHHASQALADHIARCDADAGSIMRTGLPMDEALAQLTEVISQ